MPSHGNVAGDRSVVFLRIEICKPVTM